MTTSASPQDNNQDKEQHLNRTDINQDKLDKTDQQPTDESALDMMVGLHEHETHDDEL